MFLYAWSGQAISCAGVFNRRKLGRHQDTTSKKDRFLHEFLPLLQALHSKQKELFIKRALKRQEARQKKYVLSVNHFCNLFGVSVLFPLCYQMYLVLSICLSSLCILRLSKVASKVASAFRSSSRRKNCDNSDMKELLENMKVNMNDQSRHINMWHAVSSTIQKCVHL